MLFARKIEDQSSVGREFYGKTAAGRPIEQFTLVNSNGAEAKIITFGGIITSLSVPDRNGMFGSVVLGYDSLEAYESDGFYLGALIGRFANRIAGGQFTLAGNTYKLTKNNGENALHGGTLGFHKVVWTGRGFVDERGANLELTHLSRDGEEGYPANLDVRVVYTLTENNELQIEYYAVSDAETIVGLTQHSYFNLAGHGDILAHRLRINAAEFTPVDKSAIPTGERKSVKGTPFDFCEPAAIGERIDEQDEQLAFGCGYDHNWVLSKQGKELSFAARLSEASSGRELEVWTTEPGLQFYSGNFLQSPLVYRGGLCLEAQNFPDAPNQPGFPSPVLKKGEIYRQTTIYRFSVN